MIAVLRNPWSGVVGALALIGAATLVSLSATTFGGGAPFWCLACGDYGMADALANVILFVPLGWALARTPLRRTTTVYLIVATTVIVESAQGGLIAGRVPSASDVLTNSIGGLLGLTLPAVTRRTAAPREAARAALGYGLAIGGVLAGGTLIQAIPEPMMATMTWKQSVPRLPGYTRFIGSMREVSLDSTVRVGLNSQAPDPRRAEIISTWRGDGLAWMWVDQQGRDLRTHVASRSDALRLRGHSPWLAEVMPGVAGVPVSLTFAAERFGYRFRVTTPSVDRVRSLRISPASGWRLLVPFDRTRERFAGLLTGVWMAGLLAPLGFFAARSSLAAAGIATGGAAAFLVLLPAALGCAAVPLAGWLGTAAALGGGAWVGRLRWRN